MATVKRCDVCAKLELAETSKMPVFLLRESGKSDQRFEVCQECKEKLLASIEQMRQEKGYKEL